MSEPLPRSRRLSATALAVVAAGAMGVTSPARAADAWGLPLADYSSDTGLGFGAMGGLAWGTVGTRPRSEVELFLYGSTGGEQYHSVWFATHGVAGRPLGLDVSAGYASSQYDNYCGHPGEDACTNTVEGTRYAFRHTEAYGSLSAQWHLGLSHWSVFGGWSGALHLPGIPREPTPWPDSLYAERFPDGEEGFASTLQVGVAHDTRDDEAEPSRGLWADLSLRGGSPAWGSSWAFVGGNATLRTYAPLGTDRLVAATRVGLDVVGGQQPTASLSSTGGLQGYQALGGGGMGRGIRYGRYRGQVKAVGQQELRASLFSISPLGHTVDFGAVTFVEGGWIAQGPTEMSDAAAAWSTGAGLRVGWNDLLLRADVGLSPVEGWQPYVYVDFDHLF